MAKFTPRQRKALHKVISRALLWQDATQFARDNANRSATTMLDAIEDSQFSAMALRRGVDSIIQSLDEDVA